jgi:LemA protein
MQSKFKNLHAMVTAISLWRIFKMWTTLAILGGVSALAIGLTITSSNRLQTLNARCDKASADIDVQLRHRHQLIPNLLELLKGYLAHEMKQLETVAKMQVDAVAASSAQQRLQAEDMLGTQIRQVMNSAMQVPELHANQHFMSMRHELADCDNKITAARRFLNLAVEEYNGALHSFPNSLMTRMHGLHPRNFFELGLDRPMVEESPSIKF